MSEIEQEKVEKIASLLDGCRDTNFERYVIKVAAKLSFTYSEEELWQIMEEQMEALKEGGHSDPLVDFEKRDREATVLIAQTLRKDPRRESLRLPFLAVLDKYSKSTKRKSSQFILDLFERKVECNIDLTKLRSRAKRLEHYPEVSPIIQSGPRFIYDVTLSLENTYFNGTDYGESQWNKARAEGIARGQVRRPLDFWELLAAVLHTDCNWLIEHGPLIAATSYIEDDYGSKQSPYIEFEGAGKKKNQKIKIERLSQEKRYIQTPGIVSCNHRFPFGVLKGG